MGAAFLRFEEGVLAGRHAASRIKQASAFKRSVFEALQYMRVRTAGRQYYCQLWVGLPCVRGGQQ